MDGTQPVRRFRPLPVHPAQPGAELSGRTARRDPAHRSDQIASELARHDYEADTHTRDVVEHLSQEIAALRAEQSQLLALVDHREDGEIRSRRFARTATDR
jgi:hypothetical protein